MGGTHPCIFTALDGPTVSFARKQLRFALLIALTEGAQVSRVRSWAALFATEHRAPVMENTKTGRPGFQNFSSEGRVFGEIPPHLHQGRSG